MTELAPDTAALMARRDTSLGPGFTTFYDDPVHLVRGEGVWLWDAAGRKYLDCYNNVPHVGHCNPRVVEAITRQASTLNTHTRYLHENILTYVERLTATMEDSLTAALMTCTGSEANDIALRMAEAVTGKRGIIATDFTYHGNTATVSQLSRSNRPKVGSGDFVRFVPAPDSYRPQGGEPGDAHAQAFAESVRQAIADLEASAHGFAGMIVCPSFVNEAFPDLPRGWLKPAAEAVRAAGGLLICDEVQPGFGRIGSHMWGHLYQRVTPDIVTLGKPMANGHPVGAVVTTAPIIKAFREAFRYFNTFGGNPVSCAAAIAVLDELEAQDFQENAARVGVYALEKLKDLGATHEVIGTARGQGLIMGIEFVTDRTTKAPATEFCHRVVNRLRQEGILLSSVGRSKNILKIRPPMPFSEENADLLVETIRHVLDTEQL